MDEEEFRRRLELFPVVRSPDYHIDSDPSRQSNSSRRPQPVEKVKELQGARVDQGDEHELEDQTFDTPDPFWEKLKLAAEKKVGAADAKRFCKAFQQVHRKLVYEEMNLDAARRLLKS
ncbi:hypothetical protein LINGRAHAP2_LOCUS23617 [Linum grandiflorum]